MSRVWAYAPAWLMALALALMVLAPPAIRWHGWSGTLFDLAALWIRPEDFILAGLVGLWFVKRKTFQIPRLLVLALGAFVVLPILVAVVLTIATDAPSPIAIKEIIRGCKYLTITGLLLWALREHMTLMFVTLFLTALAVVYIQLTQYFFPMFALQVMAPYESIREQPGFPFRPFATMGDPNVLANFLIVPLIVAVMAIVQKRVSWLAWLTIGAVIIGLVLTQSRTAYVAVVVAFGVAAISMMFGRRLTRRGAFRIVGAGAAALVVLVIGLNITGVDRWKVSPNDPSVAFKLESMDYVRGLTIGAAPIHAIVGRGAGGPIALGRLIEIEYGYLMLWYGLLGILAYAGVVATFFVYTANSNAAHAVKALGLGLLASMLIFGLTETTFINNRVFPMFIFGLLIAYVSGERQVSRSR